MSASAGVLDCDGMSSRLRLLLILPAVAALVWFVPDSPSKGPILMIALGVPLALRLVPRNWLYGLRVPATLTSSDEVWYRQNRIAGVTMVLIGVIWLWVGRR